ncbi:MAG: hypothetical protein EOO44_16535 [Flavobacterium sp.]|nr:MAG: hypothetical protein EOO44_16535 [Flavobacterium sp.]
MDNELIIKGSWWKRNLKWFLPTLILFLLLLVGLISTLGGNVTDITQVYFDNSLYEKAVEKAKTNQRVIEAIGEIEPLDKLAILEGNAIYSNDNKSVVLSVRVKGNKGKGKMDIYAIKNEGSWDYQFIKIRTKNPKMEIIIFE